MRLLDDAGGRFVDTSITSRDADGLAAFDWYAVVQHLSRIAEVA